MAVATEAPAALPGGPKAADKTAFENDTYEAYLEKHVTERDMFYLESLPIARQLVELGMHGTGEVIKREEFAQRKREIEEQKLAKLQKNITRLAGAGRTYTPQQALLQALAEREEAVRGGKLTTIVYVRTTNEKGQEVSGYMDYGHRLKQAGVMEDVFGGHKRLVPRPTDLSYYNWATQFCRATPTLHLQVVSEATQGLLFKCRKDRKVINVDPTEAPGDNSTRTTLTDPAYTQVVIYDHVNRRRC